MAERDKELEEKLNDLLKRAKHPEGARNALAMLFPKVENLLRTYVAVDPIEYSERRRLRRISQRDSATSYFRLDPEPASWGRTEIESILDLPPEDAFAKATAKIDTAELQHRPRLRSLFLEALDGAFGIRRKFTQVWLVELANISPYFLRAEDKDYTSFLGIDNSQRLQWVLNSALKDYSTDERYELLSAAIPIVTDVSVLSSFVRARLGDKNPKGGKRERAEPYFGGHGELIRDAVLDRIKALASDGTIWLQAEPGKLLWFWWGCDLQPEVQAFTESAIQSHAGLRAMLKEPISQVTSSAGNYEQVSAQQWSMIVDLEKLDHLARELSESSEENDRLLAMRFLAALHKGRDDPI